MSRERGFTLIELAIVLVIIGIIIGTILKGQDIIQNARYKKFVNQVRAWEVATWTYYDRKGRFPGDNDKDGKIGDGDVKTDLTGANFINPPYEIVGGTPRNTITLGSYTFYVFLGTDGGSDAGKNIMIICAAADCDTAFDDTQISYLEALDASLDGSAAGDAGQVIGVNTAPPAANIDTNKWTAYYGSAPTAAAWTAGTTKVAVYYFDAKR